MIAPLLPEERVTVEMDMTDTDGIETDGLVLVFDDDDDKIEISTALRIDGHYGPIATVDVGFDEPMDSAQRRYAAQLAHRFNCHDDLLAALKGALAWIDAVPQSCPLPAMPGFDRDQVNGLIDKAEGR